MWGLDYANEVLDKKFKMDKILFHPNYQICNVKIK